MFLPDFRLIPLFLSGEFPGLTLFDLAGKIQVSGIPFEFCLQSLHRTSYLSVKSQILVVTSCNFHIFRPTHVWNQHFIHFRGLNSPFFETQNPQVDPGQPWSTQVARRRTSRIASQRNGPGRPFRSRCGAAPWRCFRYKKNRLQSLQSTFGAFQMWKCVALESVPRCHPGYIASFASLCASPFDLPAGPFRLEGEWHGLPQTCRDGPGMYIYTYV